MSAMPFLSGSARPWPAAVDASLWRGCELAGQQATRVQASGWPELDAELPGGGWPLGALTEVLSPQSGVLEWRLCAPALKPVVAAGGTVLVVAPPQVPHLPGLGQMGLEPSRLVWVQAEAPAQRLWATEQLLRSGACAAVLAWLPQVRPEQLRRLQLAAQGGQALLWAFRPEAARHEASAAPLRLLASPGRPLGGPARGAAGALASIQLQLLKRRGPVHEQALQLPAWPEALRAVSPPRLRPAAPPRRAPVRAAQPAPEQGQGQEAHAQVPASALLAAPARPALKVLHALDSPAPVRGLAPHAA
jgi:protein ImuA